MLQLTSASVEHWSFAVKNFLWHWNISYLTGLARKDEEEITIIKNWMLLSYVIEYGVLNTATQHKSTYLILIGLFKKLWYQCITVTKENRLSFWKSKKLQG